MDACFGAYIEHLRIEWYAWGGAVMVHRKATVSLCMIVRNEAHQLEQSSGSSGWSLFDEIVVVDTGSRDATKQMAAVTPQRFEFPWCDISLPLAMRPWKRPAGIGFSGSTPTIVWKRPIGNACSGCWPRSTGSASLHDGHGVRTAGGL